MKNEDDYKKEQFIKILIKLNEKSKTAAEKESGILLRIQQSLHKF